MAAHAEGKSKTMDHSSTALALIEALHDIIDKRVAEQIENRTHTIVEEALSSIQIRDYQDEIEDIIDEKVQGMTFTVIVD